MLKSQFAMEFLMVAGFSLLIIIPMTYLLYGEYNENRKTIDMKQIDQVARELSFTAEKIYYQGEPSFTTLEIYFPRGIKSIKIGGHYINFTIEDVSTPYSYYVPFEVTGNLNPVEGTHKIRITATASAVSITD